MILKPSFLNAVYRSDFLILWKLSWDCRQHGFGVWRNGLKGKCGLPVQLEHNFQWNPIILGLGDRRWPKHPVCILQFFFPCPLWDLWKFVQSQPVSSKKDSLHLRLQKNNVGLGSVPKKLNLIPRALLVQLYTIQMICCVSLRKHERICGSEMGWRGKGKESRDIFMTVKTICSAVSSAFQVTHYLLDKTLIIDEDTLYELSLKLEPRLPAWRSSFASESTETLVQWKKLCMPSPKDSKGNIEKNASSLFQ